jgi:hypothetical protein
MSADEFDPLAPPPQAKGPTQVERDWQWLVADQRGRRIIRRMLALTAPFATSFNSDVAVMAMIEGRKQLGYMLISELTAAAPEAMVQLLVNKESE